MNVFQILLRHLYPTELDNKVHEFRVKDDRRLSLSPLSPSDPEAVRAGQGQKRQEFSTDAQGLLFRGYREFALFPPTSPHCSFIFECCILSHEFVLRAMHLCKRNQRCDRIGAAAFQLLTYSTFLIPLVLCTLARMRTCHNANVQKGCVPAIQPQKQIFKSDSLMYIDVES